jgi:hypothetical protein
VTNGRATLGVAGSSIVARDGSTSWQRGTGAQGRVHDVALVPGGAVSIGSCGTRPRSASGLA